MYFLTTGINDVSMSVVFMDLPQNGRGNISCKQGSRTDKITWCYRYKNLFQKENLYIAYNKKLYQMWSAVMFIDLFLLLLENQILFYRVSSNFVYYPIEISDDFDCSVLTIIIITTFSVNVHTDVIYYAYIIIHFHILYTGLLVI